MDIVEQKKSIRNLIKEKKSHLTSEYILTSSNKITNILLNLDTFKNAGTVMCYLSFGNEVDTKEIIDTCLKSDKTILVPVIKRNADGTSYMEASRLQNQNDDLSPGIMGILEPKGTSIRIMDPTLIDLIIVPGLAFDRKGNRLGYGAGYYDCFLERLSEDCKLIALTFSCQMVDKIPTQKHDKQIRAIITEKGLYHII